MNIKGHFETITRHKLLVMKYCFECGLYEQGLAHDLSKYSPTEFIPGCIYYQGDHSPNEAERAAKGYTSAWLHHKGRNNLQMEYYQQLKERQEEVRSLRHDVKKYILAMQAVAEHGDTEELHKIAQAATDIFERSTNVSAVGNPVVDALLNYYLRIAEKNNIKVKLDVTIPEVLTISSLSLSIILGNTFDNAIEACCSLPAEQRTIHLQLRKQYRSLFYRLENPYSDTSRGIRIGEHHGYGLKNINRIVQENHGDFYTKKKDGVFTVQVRLNCEN